MKEKNTWDLIKKVGKIKPIDEGGDSTVYSITDRKTERILGVAKNYDNFLFRLEGYENTETVEKILTQYYQDTERAKKVLEKNPNPLNQFIEIDNRKYSLQYRIISQGEVIMGQKQRFSTDKEEEIVKLSMGQEYIGALNLHLLIEYPKGSSATEEQQIFVKNFKLYQKITIIIKELFFHLSKSLNVNFGYGAMNIKPFVNKDENNITIIITDLAADLYSYYRSNPKLTMLK